MNNLKDNNTKNNRVKDPSNTKTSNWRQDKAKVLKFINNNPYIIRKKIIKIIPKTRKNTWKEIKEDLKRQYLIEYNRRKSIREQKQKQKSKPIDFIQSNIFTEPKFINEPYYPDIEEDLFNQFTNLEALELKQQQEQEQEILNKEIEKIKNADIAKDGLKIKFKDNAEVNFNNLKKVIRDKLNSIDLNGIYIQVGFLTNWNIVEYQIFALNSERGRKNVDTILRGGNFENDNYIDEDFKIEVSGMNKDFSEATVSTNQITEIKLFGKRNLGKEIKNVIYADNGGSFYPYKINEKFKQNHALIKKLKRYQIFTNLKRRAFKENCLVYAMRQTNLFSEAILDNMRLTCFTRYISKKQLQELGVMYNIKFNVIKYRLDANKWDDITLGKNKFFGSVKDDALKIKLALINGHYILNEDVKGVSTFYLKNYDDIENNCKDITQENKFKIVKKSNGKYKQDKSMYHEMKSYDFVKFMTSDQQTWAFDDLCHLQNNLYEFNTIEIKDLNNFTDRDFKAFEAHQEPKENKITKIYFADTETDTSGPYHVAFCIAYAEQDELDENFNIVKEHPKINFEFGRDCLNKFLDKIEDHSLVYFHNLGYDIRQFNEYIINKECCKNTKVMNAEIIYNDKTIYFKDTLSIVSMKLADFPKSFNLECGEKEMFPYKYYTFDNFDKLGCKGVISEAGKQELKHNWNQQQFEENLNKLGIAKDNYFNMVEYVKFYCCQDVRILKQGFQKFRKMCWESLKIDVNKTLTAPSLANQYFTREIYEKIPDYYLYGGIVRAFIQKAVYGGRCMTRLNRRWSVNEELADFDAVSLYPSAMKRLYCVKGKPEVLKSEELSTSYLLNNTCAEDEQPNKNKPISTYVVEILITNINKHLAFPCIVYKDKETNTNKNDDSEIAIGKTAVVDNITLEDWVKYNGLECEVIRGYKWTGEKSFLIMDIIQNLHLLRCEYKKTKNPLQLVIKLIMNSAYGKMIQKPITTTTEFKREHVKIFNKKTQEYEDDYPLAKYLIKNSAKVISYIQVNKNLYAIKVNKQIDTFYTNTLLGVQILSMSKRIMNEVMCTAEDIGIKIYYQDTDSMHIQKDKINYLAEEYKKRYGRELIGKNLGQFHNDFDEVENGYAYKSIFVGKKMYVDMLKNENDKYGIHYRMKGVNLDCVKLYAEENNIEIYDIYNKLYNDEAITFNLLKAKPCFKMCDNQTVINLKAFDRRIKATANL